MMKNSIDKKANARIEKQAIHKLNIASVSATLTSLICAAITPTYASDIEIYKVPEDSVGSTTLMMMLDTSGSMDNKDGLSTSRMQRLKQGLSDVLQGTASVPRVDDKVVMGLATFSGDNGYIRIPAKPLGKKRAIKSKTAFMLSLAGKVITVKSLANLSNIIMNVKLGILIIIIV